MLSSQIGKLLEEQQNGELSLYKEEKEYLEKSGKSEGLKLVERDSAERFQGAYLERSNKETEELLAEEHADFLQQPIRYLKEHQDEFLYIESEWFSVIGADTVSLEVDDIFGTYEMLLSLSYQKKIGPVIRDYLNSSLQGDRYNLLFSGEEGVWNFNFPVDHLDGFNEEMTIGETLQLVYSFLFKLAETVEQSI